MIMEQKEATGSMGDDSHHWQCLSKKYRGLASLSLDKILVKSQIRLLTLCEKE